MKLRPVVCAVFLLLCCASAAGAERCSQGQGEGRRSLGEGFAATIEPAPSEASAARCRAAVVDSEGKTVFEIFAPETLLNDISGQDVNGDSKPDVVLETRRGEPCCYTYAIVSLAAPAGQVRQITTSVPLTFQDRESDGKVEIFARDFAFQGFDGLPESLSPAPEVIFRLRGNVLHNVSPAYWPDYEREITLARSDVSRNAFDMLKSGAAGSDPRGKAREFSPGEIRQITEAKSAVLRIVLNYLYGGKGQEAWKTLQEMWTDLDKDRIRQHILRTRMTGLLSEVNRGAPPAPSSSDK